jgi:catechol 2,3-dioxygenase-like lactoylglutathione lyase family enzyme
MKLLSIRLLVSDFDACFRFYRDVMQFPVTWGAEGEGYADFDAGRQVGLSLFDRQSMSEAIDTLSLPANPEGQDRMALIFQVDDVDDAIEQLRARGANVVIEAANHPEWGIRTAHVRDPDGNLIEVNSQIPHEEWTEELKEESEKYC